MIKFKNESGIALVLAIIFVLVISLFGSALWVYGASEQSSLEVTTGSVAVHYPVRSIAESVANHIKEKPTIDVVEELFELDDGDSISVDNTIVDGMEGEYDINFIKYEQDDRGVVVNVEGRLRDSYDYINILVELDIMDLEDMFDNAIFINNEDGELELSEQHVNIRGDIASRGEIEFDGDKDEILDGEYEENVYMEMLSPLEPDISDIDSSYGDFINEGKISVSEINSEHYYIDEDDGAVYYKFDNIEVREQEGGQEGFKVDTNVDGKYKDVVIVANSVDIKSDWEVEGEGSVYLHLMGEEEDHEIQTPNVETPEDFVVFVHGEDSTVKMQANAEMSGLLYAPDSDVEMMAAQTAFKGSIIAGDMKGPGGGQGDIMGEVTFSEVLDEDEHLIEMFIPEIYEGKIGDYWK